MAPTHRMLSAGLARTQARVPGQSAQLTGTIYRAPESQQVAPRAGVGPVGPSGIVVAGRPPATAPIPASAYNGNGMNQAPPRAATPAIPPGPVVTSTAAMVLAGASIVAATVGQMPYLAGALAAGAAAAAAYMYSQKIAVSTFALMLILAAVAIVAYQLYTTSSSGMASGFAPDALAYPALE